MRVHHAELAKTEIACVVEPCSLKRGSRRIEIRGQRGVPRGDDAPGHRREKWRDARGVNRGLLPRASPQRSDKNSQRDRNAEHAPQQSTTRQNRAADCAKRTFCTWRTAGARCAVATHGAIGDEHCCECERGKWNV